MGSKKQLRRLLYPVSLIYQFVVLVRNKLFDVGVLKSVSFNLPLIVVGNLAVGGTGKSPMVEWLIKKLKNRYKVAILSRGYKRKTRGYALANAQSTALDIGDEPMQFHLKFPFVPVAVGEERAVAIPQLLHDRPETELIVLDDAFQHRYVRSGCNILLTDYQNLFTRDAYLPAGELRDLKSSYKRAQVLVVTKCPMDLSRENADKIINELQPVEGQFVFFAAIQYQQPYHMLGKAPFELDKSKNVLLLSGIAKPKVLAGYLTEKCGKLMTMLYRDHHIFSIDDWNNIIKKFKLVPGVSGKEKIILTTEKDAVRLMKFTREIGDLPIYVLPIGVEILFKQEKEFLDIITKFIDAFKVRD